MEECIVQPVSTGAHTLQGIHTPICMYTTRSCDTSCPVALCVQITQLVHVATEVIVWLPLWDADRV